MDAQFLGQDVVYT